MTITTHAAIGAAIGFHIGNPLLGFTVGVISHYLVDMIPHGDSIMLERLHGKKTKKIPIAYGTIDSLLALMLVLILSNIEMYPSTLAFTAAIAGSIMPDLLSALYDLTKIKQLRVFYTVHFFFHDYFIKRYKDVKLSYAIVAQVGFVILLLQFGL